MTRAATRNKKRRRRLDGKPDITIRIWRDGQRICFDMPEDDSLVHDALYTGITRTVDDAEHGHRVTASYYPLFGIESDGSRQYYFCPPGLLPVVEKLLQKAGYRVDTSRATAKSLPPYSLWCEPDDIELLNLVQQNERALITYSPRTVDVGWLVRQIAMAWPDKSVMVWCNRDTEAALVMRQFGPNTATLATRRHQPERKRRVLVASTSYVAGNSEVQKRDIAIVLDAGEMFSKRGLDAFKFSYEARMYGLLPEGSEHSPYVRDLLLAVFGFEKLHITEHGRVFEPPTVVQVPYKGGVRVGTNQNTALTVKQYGVWKNYGRNQFTARLCRYCVDGKARGLTVPDQLIRRVNDWNEPSIAVIVENVDHALTLGRLLPEANVVAAEHVNVAGLSRAAEERFEAAQSRKSRISIVTMAALSLLPPADVIVRADAGQSGLTDNSINVGRTSLIVDVTDRHHSLLRQWSQQRKADYDAAGWNLASVRPNSPLERWMSTRPKGALDAWVRELESAASSTL